MLETYVKLIQTGDHREIADAILNACISDAGKLHQQLLHTSTTEQ